MTQQRIFRTGASGDAPRQCWQNGVIETFAPLPTQETNSEQVALLDSRALLLTEAEIPTRWRHKALAAAAYAIEDQVAVEIEAVHLCIGQRIPPGHYPVAAVSRKLLEELLDRLDRLGIYPDRLLPDVFALPWTPSSWSVMEVDDAVLIRTGDARGLSCDGAVATTVIDSLAAESPERINLLGKPSPILDLLAAWAKARDIELVRSRIDQPPLAILAEGVKSGAAELDLLTDDYRRQRATPAHRQATIAAGLILTFAILSLVNAALDLSHVLHENAGLETRLADAYLSVAPPDAPVIDPLGQLTAMVSELRAGAQQQTGVVQLLAAVTTVEKHELEDIRADKLDFDDGALKIWVKAASSEALEQFARRLQAQNGVDAKVVSATNIDSGARGQLLVRRTDL